MRKISLLCLAALATAAVACTPDRRDDGIASPGEPRFATQGPDRDGMADLIVDQPYLAASWVIYEEFISGTSCQAIEGGISEGTHKTLRFSVLTPNIGDADVFIGDPNKHMDPNGDGNVSDSDRLYEFAECHGHFHFRNYATYELFPRNADGTLRAAIQAKKRGFCMIDVTPYQSSAGSPMSPVYRSCGLVGVPGNQGISTGWGDEYFKWLSGQFFLITDPEDPIPPGDYLIRITVNPPFKAKGKKEPCPAVDPQGFCHMFKESNYANNVAEVPITVPEGRVGKTGWGPGSGNPPPSQEVLDDENRPSHYNK